MQFSTTPSTLPSEFVVSDRQLQLRILNREERAVIEPLALEQPGGMVTHGVWDDLQASPDGVRGSGTISHSDGPILFSLTVERGSDVSPDVMRWLVNFKSACVGAIVYSVLLPGEAGDQSRLDLPSLHYGVNTYGSGIFPRPDPARGFAFRADRLAQPGIYYSTQVANWNYYASGDAPDEAQPEQLYALGIAPAQDGLRLFFRYPQREYGHRGDGGPDAYIAKSTYGAGEENYAAWSAGDTLTKTLYLWCRPSSSMHDYGTPARFLWRQGYPDRGAPLHRESSLWIAASGHIRWFNARLYNPALCGGQYESPEGSGTAMLGFVEQSLLMASTTLNYTSLCRALHNPPLSPDELDALESRASGVLTRWSTEGLSPEGLLYPSCAQGEYSFGYREYSDYENLSIVKSAAFDSIREASEARSLLSAASALRLLKGDEGAQVQAQVQAWERAALSVASWLKRHGLRGGGIASRYAPGGEALDPYPGGTASAISLFCDCSRFLSAISPEESREYAALAVSGYENTFASMVRNGIFAAGTLDASTPDREAAVAALDACLQLYELTGNTVYLSDARFAADNLLSYTMTYPISTFGRDTDAGRRAISTFGASIVSPENQHLDPVPTAPGLILYGLYTGDAVCMQAGVDSLRWALDGRWAIRDKDGLKQSEQLLNTRWYYNTFFAQRGDFRRGMPLWGRADSEHGWPQVVPTAAFLETGQLIIDWVSGRAVGVDNRTVIDVRRGGNTLTLTLGSVPEEALTGGLFVRVVRLTEGTDFRIDAAGSSQTLSAGRLAHGFMLKEYGPSGYQLVLQQI